MRLEGDEWLTGRLRGVIITMDVNVHLIALMITMKGMVLQTPQNEISTGAKSWCSAGFITGQGHTRHPVELRTA